MAQAVGTISQRTPETTEGAQSMPPRPVLLPPADIYETNVAIIVRPKCPALAPTGLISPSNGGF